MFSLLLAVVPVPIASDPVALAPDYRSRWHLASRNIFEDDHPYDDEREGLYLQLGGGLTTTIESDGPDEDIEFDEGFAIPVAFGTRFGTDDDNRFAFDLELEGLYTDQDADDEGVLEAVTDVTVIAGLVNGVADLSMTDNLSLFAGAGIGAAGLDIGTTSDSVNDFDEDDGPFMAWQLKGGLRLWTSGSLSLSAAYRFLNIDDAEIDDDLGGAEFDLETRQHILELGLRFQL